MSKTATTTSSMIENPQRWSGPEDYGISFSHLNRFLECPERFFLFVHECLDEPWDFKFEREYGSLFHGALEWDQSGRGYRKGILNAAEDLRKQFPDNGREIANASKLATLQYPEYRSYWESQPTTVKRKEIFQERGFKTPYRLPSGKVVYLRGLIDSGFTEVYRRRTRFYVQENKSKGRINERGITGGIPLDMQSLFYVIAAGTLKGLPPVNGLLYNLIRRPLSERWAPRQKKSETLDQFYQRYRNEHLRKSPEKYFMRWKVELHKTDVDKFRQHIFNPILTRLCTWWDYVSRHPEDRFNEPHGLHWLAPFGCYNSLANGWEGSYFDYLTAGRSYNLLEKRWSDGKRLPGEPPPPKSKPTTSRQRPKRKSHGIKGTTFKKQSS